MLCVFYCIPLAWFLYYASSGILFVIALFALKRGTYSRRPGLRNAAFCMMFAALFKSLMLDLRMQKDYLFCRSAPAHGLPLPGFLSCRDDGIMTSSGAMAADFSGMILFVVASLLLFNFYRSCITEKKREMQTPEQVHLRFWANLSLWMVIAMMCWLAAPWVGFLTVGSVPKIFTVVPWQDFALLNFALLLTGFWKAESCNWNYMVKDKKKMQHLTNTWTPRDTLWMNVFLYLLTLCLCYASSDVLSGRG